MNGMPNNNYRRGSAFERLLLDKLKDRGYDGLRSAGSHSSVDLIVWEDLSIIDQLLKNQSTELKVYAIQCKTSKEEKFNLSNLIWEDSVRELTGLSDNLTKVLCIKQYRKITTLVWNNGWKESDIFNLNKLTRKGKNK
jgi:Holliday junction resolvase